MLVMADELSKREQLLEALQNGDPAALEFAQRAASAPNEDHEVELQVSCTQHARPSVIAMLMHPQQACNTGNPNSM